MTTEQPATSELDRAMRAINENRWVDAIVDLQVAHDRQPDNVGLTGKLAFALSRDGRYGDAVRLLEELHRRQPQEAKWPYMIGFQHYQNKDWKEAIKWFDRALDLRPEYVKVLYRKGYAHVALAQENEAINALSDCIRHWEKMNSDAQEQDRSIYAKAQFQLGKLLLKKGLTVKASRHLQIAAQNHAQDHDFLYELGQCHLKNNRLDDALRELQAADRIKPGTDYIIDRLAQTYAKRGDYAIAERTYAQIPQHRRRAFISQHLGMLYVESGQAEKAITHLHIAARKQPDNHNIHYFLGRALESLGKVREAHASYSNAVKFRRMKYNLDFKDAEQALIRTSEVLSNSPMDELRDTSPGDEGVIESYNDNRVFGFITTKTQQRVFFHVSSYVGPHKPRAGSTVVFTSELSTKGLRALHVELLTH
jgi:tetratricopeptide (TPR) repeat protein